MNSLGFESKQSNDSKIAYRTRSKCPLIDCSFTEIENHLVFNDQVDNSTPQGNLIRVFRLNQINLFENFK